MNTIQDTNLQNPFYFHESSFYPKRFSDLYNSTLHDFLSEIKNLECYEISFCITDFIMGKIYKKCNGDFSKLISEKSSYFDKDYALLNKDVISELDLRRSSKYCVEHGIRNAVVHSVKKPTIDYFLELLQEDIDEDIISLYNKINHF